MSPSFWHIDLGNVATWVAIIVAGIGFIWRFSRRIDLIEDSQKSGAITLQKLSDLVERMNSSGTTWSREKLVAESLLQGDHARRIIDLEAAYKDVAPKIASMAADVGWIKHHIQLNGKNGTQN